jgi:hypothetical protein
MSTGVDPATIVLATADHDAVETMNMTRRPSWLSRRAAVPFEPLPRLPSLNLLLQVTMQERDKQLAHFDALDTKAGVLLAFDGVLIAVSRGIRFAFLLPGVILTSVSAVLALAAFWPRKFPALDPWVLRQFLTYETEDTGLKLHDTIARAVTQGGRLLHLKARNLKLALMLLLLAAITFGAGTVVTTNSVSTGRIQHGTQEPTRQPARPTVSPSPSPSRS